jgi:hypothetical protein
MVRNRKEIQKNKKLKNRQHKTVTAGRNAKSTQQKTQKNKKQNTDKKQDN